MIKTIRAYRQVINNKWLFLVAVFIVLSFLFVTSYKAQRISPDIQDSILSVVSILFPLIAGFLTFGREIIKDLNERINSITQVDSAQSGRPTPDVEKRKIVRLKSLASNFKSVIISTFFISFILIIYVLFAKFNSYEFNTQLLDFNNLDILIFIKKNIFGFLMKLIFFATIFTLFINLSYLVYFIIEVNKEEV